MVEFLDLDSLLRIADQALPEDVLVRDRGLLLAALARPQAAFGGVEAYPTLTGKAAALLSSLVGNHALVDGNKRLGWQATHVLLWINGLDVDADEDTIFDLVMDVAAGSTAADGIKTRLDTMVQPLTPPP